MTAEKLLEQAISRNNEVQRMDAEGDNILFALHREYDEAHTHSRLIYYLLNAPARDDNEKNFLSLFLKQIGVPDKYIADDRWTVYRERAFDEGRIDFVLESSEYLVAIEMKVGAEDGDRQLKRYDRFCKSRMKEYGLYYLTLFGKEPRDYSVVGVDSEHFHCISFVEDILIWLEKCIELTEFGGYKYSFIKQYIGTVKKITNKGTQFGMGDLIKDSESAFAVMELTNELDDKMLAVAEDFLNGLMNYIKEKTGKKSELYDFDMNRYLYGNGGLTPGFYTILDRVNMNSVSYRFMLFVEYDPEACWGFCFDKVVDGKDEWIQMSDVEAENPDFYRKHLESIDKIDIRDFKRSNHSWWAYIESTRGGRFDFFKRSKDAVYLLDDMDVQIEYIGDFIVNQVLKNL